MQTKYTGEAVPAQYIMDALINITDHSFLKNIDRVLSKILTERTS